MLSITIENITWCLCMKMSGLRPFKTSNNPICYEDVRATPLIILENIHLTKMAGLRSCLFLIYIKLTIQKILKFWKFPLMWDRF